MSDQDDREGFVPLSQLPSRVFDCHAHTSDELLKMLERAIGTRAIALHVLLTRDEEGRLTATRVEP